MRAVKMISDGQFEKVGLAIGQIAMLKALMKDKQTEGTLTSILFTHKHLVNILEDPSSNE